MYRRNIQGWSKHIDFFIVDEIALQLALFLSLMLVQHKASYAVPQYRGLAIVYALVDFVLMVMFDTMHKVLKRNWFDELLQTLEQCMLVFALSTAYIFAWQASAAYSRQVLFLTLTFHAVIGYLTRIFWKHIINRYKIFNGQKGTMLVVLHTATAEETMKRLLDNSSGGYKIIGAILNEYSYKTEIEGIPIVAELENASDYIVKEWVDAVYIDSAPTDTRVRKLMMNCNIMGITVHYHVIAIGKEGSKSFIEKIAGTTVLTSTINYATPAQSWIKRFIDIIGGLIGSIIALGIIIWAAPKIKKLSPGPILYTQERIGRNGKRFKMYKIRSMYMNADERKKELMKQNRIKDSMMFKLDWDPRIIGNETLPDGTKQTGIGEYIRKKSLDEFPQFFNVLLSQMSIVGTRPPTVDEWEKYKFHHRARMACKPGITGLWQVSGRSEITNFEEVVKLDTQYITDWSIGLDIKILFKTILVVLKGKGAM